jgi:hypothetical protein
LLAARLLSEYTAARAVITTRLHCALPCLALGTPVLFVPTAHDDYRFSGLRDLLHVTSPEKLLAGDIDYDFRDPPPNRTEWMALRDGLTQKVAEHLASNPSTRVQLSLAQR